jgi:DNA adenine methylase
VGARPVVKWAGGKSRLLEPLRAFMPEGSFGTYAEPFCGGAAMFFALAAEPERRFRRAVLADKNDELVALYTAIRDDVDGLIEAVRRYQEDHLRKDAEGRRKHYYAVRKRPTAKMTRAQRGARLLFLNKTCFNGLWRVNASGQFNVPFGRYAAPKIFDEEALRAAHHAFADVRVVHGDFTEATRSLEEGDFAYFDPPYAPVSKTSSFTAYARDRFGWEEQERLADELVRLRAAGVRAMLSNARTPELEALYAARGFSVEIVTARRAINSDPTKRGEVDELVVTTYPGRGERRAAS